MSPLCSTRSTESCSPRLRRAPPAARSTSCRRAPHCSARAREAAPVAADGNGWRGVCDGGCGIAMESLRRPSAPREECLHRIHPALLRSVPFVDRFLPSAGRSAYAPPMCSNTFQPASVVALPQVKEEGSQAAGDTATSPNDIERENNC
jgi:hypothetical protein